MSPPRLNVPLWAAVLISSAELIGMYVPGAVGVPIPEGADTGGAGAGGMPRKRPPRVLQDARMLGALTALNQSRLSPGESRGAAPPLRQFAVVEPCLPGVALGNPPPTQRRHTLMRGVLVLACVLLPVLGAGPLASAA